MPIYEYKCTKCDKNFECLVFKADEEVSCPSCHGDEVERLMSACSFKSTGGGSDFSSASSSSSGCSSCSGGNCSTCH